MLMCTCSNAYTGYIGSRPESGISEKRERSSNRPISELQARSGLPCSVVSTCNSEIEGSPEVTGCLLGQNPSPAVREVKLFHASARS